MTLVVGFRKRNHDLLLAADSRITWAKRSVRVDEVQKVYLPAPKVAIAFAGNDVTQIQTALRSFRTCVLAEDFTTNEEPASRYNNRLVRVLRAEAATIQASTSLIVGIMHGLRPEANVLKALRIWDGSIQSEVDIPAGEHRAMGSAVEEEHAEMLSGSIAQAFVDRELPPPYPQLDIVHHAEILTAQYATAWEMLRRHRAALGDDTEEGLDTAGPLLHCVLGINNRFHGFGNTIEVTFRGGRSRYGIRYNTESGTFEQVNEGERIVQPLYSVDRYDFSRSPTEDNLFDVSPR